MVKKNIKSESQQKRVPVVLFLGVLFVLINMFYSVYSSTKIKDIKRRITMAQKKMDVIISYHNILLVKRQRLDSSDRIVRLGKNKLNLSTNTLDQTFFMDENN